MTVEQLYSIIYKRFDLIFDLVAALSVCMIRNKAFIFSDKRAKSTISLQSGEKSI